MNKQETKNNVAIDFNNEVITTANAMQIANRIALRALKTLLKISYSEYLNELNSGLKRYIASGYKDVCDGSDVLSEVCLVINAFCNKGFRLIDVVEYNGKQATIKKLCYNAVNNYINAQKKILAKTVYVDEIDENGERVYIPIPKGWDVDNVDELKALLAYIDRLELTTIQRKTLFLRLKGYSIEKIAKLEKRQVNAIQCRVELIRKKCKDTILNDLRKTSE